MRREKEYLSFLHLTQLQNKVKNHKDEDKDDDETDEDTTTSGKWDRLFTSFIISDYSSEEPCPKVQKIDHNDTYQFQSNEKGLDSSCEDDKLDYHGIDPNTNIELEELEKQIFVNEYLKKYPNEDSPGDV